MRFGVNLWGVYPHVSNDFEGFFAKFSALGYRFIEPCIVLGEAVAERPQFLDEEHLGDLLALAEKYGVRSESAHVMRYDAEKAVSIMKRLAERFGIRQFVFNNPREVNEETYSAFAEVLKGWADALGDVRVVLHNGAHDSCTCIEGIPAYEWILKKCEGKVYAEADAGWLAYAGLDPEEFLWKNAELVSSVHYKDFVKEDGEYKECDLGNGVLDMTSVFQFARAHEVIQYVDQDGFAQEVFASLENSMKQLSRLQNCRDNTDSVLCILDTETGDVEEVQKFAGIIEAPNWLQHENALVFNREGHLYKYSLDDKSETLIDTGSCDNCNNDHVPSPDEKSIAISHSEGGGFFSRVYLAAMDGSGVRLVTENGPSYLHGFSPEGNELAYCAFRKDAEGKNQVDIFAISVDGGEEWQLTKNAGFNDGPEYSFDGKHIWFISTRSGLMQVYRMDRDGSNQIQMTFEEQNNWFGHISPDNKKVLNIAYSKDGLDPNQHLANMHVSLWLMNSDGSERHKVLDLFGGQGSINVNSWAPDSRRAAFVRYELHHR